MLAFCNNDSKQSIVKGPLKENIAIFAQAAKDFLNTDKLRIKPTTSVRQELWKEIKVYVGRVMPPTSFPVYTYDHGLRYSSTRGEYQCHGTWAEIMNFKWPR